MDPEKLSKLIQACAALLTAIGVVLTAITGFVQGWPNLFANPLEWSSRETVFALAVLLVVGGVFLLVRSRKARVSHLVDPDALRLNPQSPDQLVGRADDLRKLSNALAQPLVFLVGESGCESALLRIGVEQGSEFIARFLPIYIDMSAQDWDDGPVRALREGFVRALPAEDSRRQDLDARSGPRAFREAFQACYQEYMRRPLLLLDQFDDYQARHRDRFLPDATNIWRRADAIAAENRFWRVLRLCLAQDVFSVLVACRDDAQGGLESVSFLPSPPRFELPRLGRGYVRRIIDQRTDRPTGAPAVIADPENGWTKLRDRLVDELEARGSVLPQQLKVVLGGCAPCLA
jgi:hypothetical protein